MVVDFFSPMVRLRRPGMVPVYLNFVLSIVWSYLMLIALILGLFSSANLLTTTMVPSMRFLPEWWGMTLALTYLAQAGTALLIEERYERNLKRWVFWMIWYPMAFWLLTTLTAVVSLPRAIFRPRRERTTWVSPDRGLR